MIKVLYKDGRYSPLVICDICSERIEDAALGAAVAPSGQGGDDQLLEVLHAHKGGCHKAAEERLGGKVNTGWDELGVHMLNLAMNVKLSPEALSDLRKLEDEFAL